jgi:ABC-type polysaccharide/polyol phosphate transport system ATPase subunit
MRPGAVAIQDLSKSYRLYARPGDMLVEALTGRRRHAEFRALEGISFAIEPGTVLGIMGRNGAGKSTLLRIIAGTLPATGGTVSTQGRIAAILELGTGFHPDYTGRENVELGGLCLGMSRAQIRERFDEIVAFSELEEFIDRPFSTYSTGMQARLTFAVATCVDPDILIVDEALSVGDAKFQLKSFDRIREFKRRGKSILLVINQVVSICDRAILLERGRIHADADPNKIGHVYHELLFGAPATVAEAGHGEFAELDEGLDDEAAEEPVRSRAPQESPAENDNDAVATAGDHGLKEAAGRDDPKERRAGTQAAAGLNASDGHDGVDGPPAADVLQPPAGQAAETNPAPEFTPGPPDGRAARPPEAGAAPRWLRRRRRSRPNPSCRARFRHPPTCRPKRPRPSGRPSLTLVRSAATESFPRPSRRKQETRRPKRQRCWSRRGPAKPPELRSRSARLPSPKRRAARRASPPAPQGIATATDGRRSSTCALRTGKVGARFSSRAAKATASSSSSSPASRCHRSASGS